MADYDIVSGAITQHIVVTCHVRITPGRYTQHPGLSEPTLTVSFVAKTRHLFSSLSRDINVNKCGSFMFN